MRLSIFVIIVCCTCFAYAQDFKKFQRPFTPYTVNPDSCIRIQHPSGSLIFIEAKAIITNSETATIHYREFFTPIDMLVHGILMHMQIGGDRFQLESSGMFEIYALDGGDTLSFDSEKHMEVRLKGPTEMKPGTEGFQYDPAKQHWESYTSQIGRLAIEEDDQLWGSSIVQERLQAINYDEPFQSFETYADTVRRNVFQSMEISEFGFYNYDRIIEEEEYVYFTPQFISNQKEPLISTIFVVYDDINSVFYFPEYTWEDQFFLIKERSYKLFTIADDGNVLNLNNMPDLDALNGQSNELVLDTLREIPKDRNSLAKLTGIR